MPITLPDTLPAIDLLRKENIFVQSASRSLAQEIRPLRIVCLNLMPLKITTETDIIRLLSNTPLQIELDFIRLRSHTPKNTPIEHLLEFYIDFDEIKRRKYDGLIVTGAPLEHMPFDDVNYWEELKGVLYWAKTNVTSCMFICWAAQAAAYYYYGIPKYPLSEKMFGVFEHHVLEPRNPLFRGFDDVFYMPHSRHTEVKREDILSCPELKLMSESEDAGVAIMMARGGREVYVFGHAEYTADTLGNEYKRDLEKGKPIHVPYNYYPNDDATKNPIVRWRGHANLLYLNWLNYFVYQETPYDLDKIM